MATCKNHKTNYFSFRVICILIDSVMMFGLLLWRIVYSSWTMRRSLQIRLKLFHVMPRREKFLIEKKKELRKERKNVLEYVKKLKPFFYSANFKNKLKTIPSHGPHVI